MFSHYSVRLFRHMQMSFLEYSVLNNKHFLKINAGNNVPDALKHLFDLILRDL
jgi:hypothetical protein